jgi:hypothetical protein
MELAFVAVCGSFVAGGVSEHSSWWVSVSLAGGKPLSFVGLIYPNFVPYECIFAEGYLWLADAAVYFVHNYDGGAH